MRQTKRTRRISRATGLALMVALAGCTTQRVPAGGAPSEVGPSLVIERFLQSANAVAGGAAGDAASMERLTDELETMTRLFGTRERPVRELYPRDEVEEWMLALADLLRHEGFGIEGSRLVPGRVGEAMQVTVRLRTAGRTVDVPFTVVQTREGGWRIELIDTERLTAGS